MKRWLGWMLPLVLGLALFAGCKQGEGDRCEIDTDCDDGLQCCSGSNTCRPTCVTNQPDAAVGVDARILPDAQVTQDASP